MNKAILSAAIASVLTAGVAMGVSAAEDKMESSKVKCYGIAKAGKNDCKDPAGAHSCAGQATKDNAATEWKFSPSAEQCMKDGGKTS